MYKVASYTSKLSDSNMPGSKIKPFKEIMKMGTPLKPLPSFRNLIKWIKLPFLSTARAIAGNFRPLVQHFKNL